MSLRQKGEPSTGFETWHQTCHKPIDNMPWTILVTQEVHEKVVKMQLERTQQGTNRDVREQELDNHSQRLMDQQHQALHQREPGHRSLRHMVQLQQARLQLQPANLHLHHRRLDNNRRLLLKQDQNMEHQEKDLLRQKIHQPNELEQGESWITSSSTPSYRRLMIMDIHF